MQYEMHGKSHTIIRLAIHLPHQQPVCFTDPQQAAQINNESMLMAYFSLNQREGNAHRSWTICPEAHIATQKRATCMQDIRTVDGITYDTFKNAARAMSLLENDVEHRRCLRDAVVFHLPAQMRQLFATLILFQTPSDNAIFTEF
eukprot:gene1043-biopygen276